MIRGFVDSALTPNPFLRRIADPIFRILTSLIFIVGGLGHFFQDQKMLERMAESPWRHIVGRIGEPIVLLWLSGAVFVIFGVSLALGFLTRLSALLIFVTLVPITIATHLVPDPDHIGPLFKNIAILGALIFFMAHGGGAIALDNRIRTRVDT